MLKKQLILTFFKQNRPLSAVALGAGLFASVLTILLPVSLGKYFDLLFGFDSRRGHFLDWLPRSFWADVPSFLCFFLGLVLLRTGFNFLQRYAIGVLGERFVRNTREELFGRQLRTKTAIYEQKGIGKYLLRYAGDMKSIQDYITKGILQFAIDLILMLVTALFLAWMNWQVLLVVGLGLAFTLVVVYFLNKILYRISVERRNRRSRLLAFVNERLLSAATLKAFNKEVPEEEKFNKHSERLYAQSVHFQRIYNIIYALVPGLLYFVLAGVLWTIYALQSKGAATFDSASMLSFVLVFITVLPVLRRLVRVNSTWELGNISFQKLLKVLNMPSETEGRKKFKFKKGTIEAIDLGFGFSKKKLLFEGLNFSIEPNKITVLTAPAGYGKSALAKLMLGIYEPQQGKILVDKQDVAKMDLKTLRRSMTAVSNDFLLLGNTVFEAVSYSRKEDKRPLAAQMLESLQEGLPAHLCLSLDDKIGELGVNLSAGQRKLLGYVRAFLTQKPILLVDEPFTDLPVEARIAVTRQLLNWREHATIVLFSSEWTDAWLDADMVINLGKPGRPHGNLTLPGQD